MLNVFKEVVNGTVKEYGIKNPIKLADVAKSIGIDKAKERILGDMDNRRKLEAL